MSLYLPGGHAAHVPVAIASDLYSPNPQITGVGAFVGTGVGIGVGGAGVGARVGVGVGTPV